MTIENFLSYGRQSIDAFDITDLSEALTSPLITRGPKVTEFEQKVAAYCGARYGVAFCNGTAALEAAYYAGELGPYDRVVSTPNTFVGTVVAPLKQGCNLVFVDINRSSGNIDLQALEPNAKYRSTRGKLFVVPVHFAGIACDMYRLRAMVKHPSSMIIEDAAHALGSTYPTGEKVGSCVFSDMTVFSFHPVKTITTGEGGMVLTNDPKLVERLRLFRNNGIVKPDGAAPWEYQVVDATGNYNLTDFQAALGLSQLKKLDTFVEKRRALVKNYRSQLDGKEGIRLFDASFDDRTAYHLFTVQIDFDGFKISRAKVMAHLKEQGIGTQVHYIPIYRHQVAQVDLDIAADIYPEMEGYYGSALSLPLYPDMTHEDVDRVSTTLMEILRG